MKKSRKVVSFAKYHIKRMFSAALIAAILMGTFVTTDMYNGLTLKAYAKDLEGISSNVVEPTWNINNIPARDTTGTVKYYFAGNEFYALNQFGDGVQQSDSGTSGHLKIYSDSNGVRLVETTYNGEKAIKGNASSCSDFNSYNQRTDIDFSKTSNIYSITVTAGDGMVQKTYNISVLPELSTNNNITSITVDGNVLKPVDKVFNYDSWKSKFRNRK